jgi:hypothetical protein
MVAKMNYQGVYCLLTNDCSMGNEKILETCLKLTNIENVFKSIKSELGLKPKFS